MSKDEALAYVMNAAVFATLTVVGSRSVLRASRAWPRERWRVARNASLTILAAALTLPPSLARLLPVSVQAPWASALITGFFGSIVGIIGVAVSRRRRGDSIVAPTRSEVVMKPTAHAVTDRGWEGALRLAGRNLVPPFNLFGRRTVEVGGLTSLRIVMIGLAGGMLMFVAAFSYIAPWDGGDDGLAPVIIVVVGTGCLAIARALSLRPLDVSSAAALKRSYSNRTFTAIGIVDIVPLGAIGLTFFIQDSLWLICLGVGIGLLGLWMIAPRRANLARDQGTIFHQGSTLDLIETLETPPTPPPAALDVPE
ncbi:MAG TPA: hypothetical protein VF108_04065 [Actinomycetota bacterium]